MTSSVASPPQRRTSSMMNLLERMNPLVCLGGSIGDTIDSNEVTEDSSNDSGGPNDIKQHQKNKRNNIASSSTYGCMSPLRSKYQPDDKVEELLTSDYLVDALEQKVPELLECISLSSPPVLAEGSSRKKVRKSDKAFNARRTEALKKLYELTKKEKEYNRIPLVCTAKWDTIGILTDALLVSEDQTTDAESNNSKPSLDEDRRLICWTLNNLSIPYENKATILEQNFSKLLKALTSVLQFNLPESYLCCIFLMNVTFLADSILPTILFYVPPSGGRDVTWSGSSKSNPRVMRRSSSLRLQSRTASGVSIGSESVGSLSDDCKPVLENPSSLLCTVEKMMMTNSPFILSPVKSVQRESIRWACGFIRNVTFTGDVADGENNQGNLTGSAGRQGVISNASIEKICTLISRTEIPRLTVMFVRDSPHPTVKWTKDSLEDIALGIMCNMAQWPSSRESLKRAGAVQCLETIEGLAGIHGYRARAIRCSLGALPMQLG